MVENLRLSTVYFLCCILCLTTIVILGIHAAAVSGPYRAADAESAELARRLKLTDLCLFTEARYTRHPSMADNHAAFQEHPSAFDHFPSGAFLLPQKTSRRN